jgi:hypothetical protein
MIIFYIAKRSVKYPYGKPAGAREYEERLAIIELERTKNLALAESKINA